MVRLLALFAFGLLAACGSPCQTMCQEMAAYAEECGYSPSDEEVQACMDQADNAEPSDARAEQCITASDPDQLREWWTCEELFDVYENANPS